MRLSQSIILSLLLLFAPWPVNAADNAPLDETTLSDALRASIELQQQREQYEQHIAELETELGGFDSALLEPLGDLTDFLTESGNLEEAARLLDRRLQLIRTLEGPDSLDQLPVLEEMVVNDISRQEWQQTTDHLEYIYWLHSQDPDMDAQSLLSARDEIAQWLLARIYLDRRASRISNFLDARELTRENLSFAEDYYNESAPELIPWLYQHAVLQYQIYSFVVAEDELGLDAKEDILRIEARPAINYLREGLNTVKRINEDIIVPMNNPEAEAMAMIYEADFQMLLALGTAPRKYREAKEKFREAGLDEQTIEDFFYRPVVLPVTKYHLTMEDALKAQDERGFETFTEEDEEGVHLGDFMAWNESLPSARRPPVPDFASSLEVELNFVEMEFSINSRGRTSNPKPLLAVPDEARVKREARDGLKRMQFRPRFVEGRWRRADPVRMRYRYPAD